MLARTEQVQVVMAAALLVGYCSFANGNPCYEATWESLKNYEAPAWYEDAKFGIFIHWGPYAVPGFDSEWYPSHMYDKGRDAYKHHRKEWGNK